jgi:hypothetical protein
LPMPCPPPVTITTFPSNKPMEVLSGMNLIQRFLIVGSRVSRFDPLQINYHRPLIIVKSRTATFLN